MKKPKVILDTNIFVNGLLLSKSKPHKILRLWQNGHFVLLISPEILKEITQVFSRDKLKKKYKVDSGKIDKLINEILERAQFLLPSVKINVCRDPEGNKFLELAEEGKADFLVTGDRDLLTLKRFNSTQIITPAQFLEIQAQS